MTAQELIEILSSRDLTIEERAGTLNLAAGRGVHQNRANIDLEDVLTLIEGRREAASNYADGVEEILKESPRSLAHRWNFAKSAATLLPCVRPHAYLVATEHASGSPAANIPITADLYFTFTVRTDVGRHVVTEQQFDAWQISRERMRSAARSMLYHYTEDASWKPEDQLRTLSVGDGHDPARFCVIEDLDHDHDIVFVSFPDHGRLIVSGQAGLSDLRRETERLFDEAAKPLDRRLYRLENQTLTLT